MANAQRAGVERIITVGVDDVDSGKAVAFAKRFDNVWATVGLHPHDANRGQAALQEIARLAESAKVVAIGECGLDYFRNLSTPKEQEAAFRAQIELAQRLNLPMVWHVREAFDDFFRIVDQYTGVRGVVHCFTSNADHAKRSVERGFYVALNGIMTFTKDVSQLEAARSIPLSHLLLETDCPFLTPAPLRGQTNQPAHIELTAKFLAHLRDESPAELANQTTKNAIDLFGLK